MFQTTIFSHLSHRAASESDTARFRQCEQLTRKQTVEIHQDVKSCEPQAWSTRGYSIGSEHVRGGRSIIQAKSKCLIFTESKCLFIL